jgi:hypothetical protein
MSVAQANADLVGRQLMHLLPNSDIEPDSCRTFAFPLMRIRQAGSEAEVRTFFSYHTDKSIESFLVPVERNADGSCAEMLHPAGAARRQGKEMIRMRRN